MPKKIYDYDICLSFAGEARKYVEAVAKDLSEKRYRVFYDKFEEANLLGKDLIEYLDTVYREKAKYCAVFISKHYRVKNWTRHERKSAQARAFTQKQEYLLPLRFDDTKIPGLLDTIGYIDLSKTTTFEISELLAKKIGTPGQGNYFPEESYDLQKRFGIKSNRGKAALKEFSIWFMSTLKKLNTRERHALFLMFLHGCTHELPKNIHISKDLLARVTGIKTHELKKLLSGLASLGFVFTERAEDNSPQFVIEWHDLRENGLANSTMLMDGIFDLMSTRLCGDHALELLMKLDFWPLSVRCSQKKKRICWHDIQVSI